MNFLIILRFVIISISPPHFFPASDLLHRIIISDIHVILDTIPFEENGLLNRCKIQTSVGWQWINVPVLSKNINEEIISDLSIYTSKPWEKKHFDTITASYKKAPYFKKYLPFIENLFTQKWKKIIDLDIFIYDFIFKELEISTKIVRASDYKTSGKYIDQIIFLLDELVADVYFAESYQKNYLDTEKYREKLEQIKVQVKYQSYKPTIYPQLHNPFAPLLSVVDLLLNLDSKETKRIIMKDNLKKIKTL